MGDPVIEVVEYTADIPSIVNGENADGDEFMGPIQPLANRTAYFHNVVDVVGVKRIAEYADFASLQAYHGQADGDYADVLDTGIYRFHATGGSPFAGQPILVVPGGGVAGYWEAQGLGTLAINANQGIAGINSSGRLSRPDVTPNGLFFVGGSFLSADSAALSSADTEVTGLALGLGTLTTNDIVCVDAAFTIKPTTTAASPGSNFRLQIKANTTAVYTGYGWVDNNINGGLFQTFNVCGLRFNPPAAGTTTLHVLMHAAPTGGDVTFSGGAPLTFMRAMVVRP